jgi:Flp pilus assembly protein TadB
MGKNTHDFTHSLLKQLKNNVIIARVNKHMTWIVGPLMVAFFVLDGYMRDYPLGQLATIFARVSLLAAVLFIPWYYWCNKRQIRFENEAQELERVLR